VSTHNLSDGCCTVGLTFFVQAGRTVPPRVVAVSKKHSLEKVQWAYQKGLRHFGENYVRLSECILCDCDVGLFPLGTPYILSAAQSSCKLVKLHHDCKLISMSLWQRSGLLCNELRKESSLELGLLVLTVCYSTGMSLHNPMSLAQTMIIVKMNTIVQQTHTIGVGGHTELKRA